MEEYVNDRKNSLFRQEQPEIKHPSAVNSVGCKVGVLYFKKVNLHENQSTQRPSFAFVVERL